MDKVAEERTRLLREAGGAGLMVGAARSGTKAMGLALIDLAKSLDRLGAHLGQKHGLMAPQSVGFGSFSMGVDLLATELYSHLIGSAVGEIAFGSPSDGTVNERFTRRVVALAADGGASRKDDADGRDEADRLGSKLARLLRRAYDVNRLPAGREEIKTALDEAEQLGWPKEDEGQ